MLYYLNKRLWLSHCLSAQLFRSVTVPCPHIPPHPQLGLWTLKRNWLHLYLAQNASPEVCTQDHLVLIRSFSQDSPSIYCVPGLELKAEGTMMNTTDTTVLFKSQFVDLNPLSAALLFANIFNKMTMEWGLGNNQFLILKRKSRKARLYSLYHVFLMTDLTWK